MFRKNSLFILEPLLFIQKASWGMLWSFSWILRSGDLFQSTDTKYSFWTTPRSDILSELIWVQTVCKDYHQTTNITIGRRVAMCRLILTLGAQWLKGRVLDSRSKRGTFEFHRRHIGVSLSNTHTSLINTGSRQEDPSLNEWINVDWDVQPIAQSLLINSCLQLISS